MAVASCKAWQLLGGTRLSKVVAYRGMAVDIGGMRKPYGSKEDVFDFEHLVGKEPFAQFKAWFDEATKHEKVGITWKSITQPLNSCQCRCTKQTPCAWPQPQPMDSPPPEWFS